MHDIVFLCTQAAIKTTQFHAFDARTSFFALREALVLSQLPAHPALPRLLDIIQTTKETHVVQSLAEGEELFSYVNNQPDGRLQEDEAASVVAQLLSALSAIHNNGIIHRDIKLDNVFISPSGQITLIDFGLATFFGSKTVLDEAVGCINYASPALLRLVNNGTPYSPEMGHSDLWALGVLAVGMLTGFFPFRSEEPKGLADEIARIGSEGLLAVASGLEGVSAMGKSFLQIVLDPCNEGRISAGLLLKHPWVSRFANSAATTASSSISSTEKPKIPKIPSPNAMGGGVYKARKAVETHLKTAISKLEEEGRSLSLAAAPRASMDTVHQREVERAGSGESLESQATLLNGLEDAKAEETLSLNRTTETFPWSKKEEKHGKLKAALAAPGKWFDKIKKR